MKSKPKSKKRPACPRCLSPCDIEKDVKGKFRGVNCWRCGYVGDGREYET